MFFGETSRKRPPVSNNLTRSHDRPMGKDFNNTDLLGKVCFALKYEEIKLLNINAMIHSLQEIPKENIIAAFE